MKHVNDYMKHMNDCVKHITELQFNLLILTALKAFCVFTKSNKENL